jgi:4-hydroxy-4-methyl-2-oxoglutarate aldolase
MGLDLLKSTSSSVLSDALEHCGVHGQCRGLFPSAPGQRLFGRAYTVRVSPFHPGALAHDEYMEDLQPGEVCVLDARGVEGAVWGDLRSHVAQRIGVAGAVADGPVRDGDACAAMGFPVFARSRTPLSGNRRAWIEAKAVPVVVGGVFVAPGDLIFGDGDGVIVIPSTREEEVLARAEDLEAADQKMVAALKDGVTLAEARRRFGVKSILPSKT